MSVPSAVQKQDDQAREAWNALQEQNIEAPESAPEPEDNGNTEPEPTPVESPAPEPEKQGESELEKTAHKLKVVEGKYNAEVPRLSEQLREAKAELLKKDQEIEKARLLQPVDPEAYGLTEAESAYGPEMVSAAAKVVKAEMEARLGPLRDWIEARFTEIQESLSQAQNEIQDTKVGTFDDLMRTRIPEMMNLEYDAKFQKWLADELLDTALREAYETRDIAKMERIVERYKGSIKKTSPQQAVASQVVPSPMAGADQVGPKKYHIQDWIDIQQAATRGEYTTAEYEKLKAEYIQADSEGRLIRS